MNKLKKHLFDYSKKIVMTHADKLVEKTITEMEGKINDELTLNVFNSGIILDVKKLKIFGLKHLQKQIKKRSRNKS